MARIFVLGLDGAAPELVFKKWRKHLPNISELMQQGSYCTTDSTIPPSTIIAWNSFCSGYDAGQLGVYAYTKRGKKSLDDKIFVNSTHVKKPLIWDVLSKKGKKCNVIHVPLTYPVRKINGRMVSGFLTPGLEFESVYPKSFKKEIKKISKNYMFDVGEFLSYKSMNPKKLLEKVYQMTEMNFKLIKKLVLKKDWDFFMSVIIGTDRLNHLFWHYFDQKHVLFKKGSRYKNALRDYFKFVDKNLGKIRKILPKDTVLVVASDHGMDRMDAKINVNDWLIKKGYLVLKKDFAQKAKKGPVKIKLSGIDFSKTKAYSIGSYQARIYINLKGRDNEGVVLKKDFNKIRRELEEKLSKIRGIKGQKLNTKFFKPEQVYKKFDSEAPDLIVYFDNLIYGSNDEVGNRSLYSMETVVGKTMAGHAPKGIFVIHGPNIKKRGFIGEKNILNVAPTFYKILKIKKPKGLQAKNLDIF